MYIPIYEQQPKTEKYALRLIHEKYALRLIHENDEPTLCIVDKATGEMVERGRLCYITRDGRLRRTAVVNETTAAALGIQLRDSFIALG